MSLGGHFEILEICIIFVVKITEMSNLLNSKAPQWIENDSGPKGSGIDWRGRQSLHQKLIPFRCFFFGLTIFIIIIIQTVPEIMYEN